METQSFVEEINYRDIEFKEVVGKGAFGVVSRGIWRGKHVAVKNIETESERKAFLTELKQLSRVNHPNIVKLYGACTKHPVCLVMEYAEGGSLYNVLHGNQYPYQPVYTAAHAMSWALQCARGVEYLHGMSPKALIHRDLKPPNLLLILGGAVLKICDFGTACDIQTHMTNNKGSAAWMAPEVFEGSNYSEKCDVFSWGIILWEVITRRKPFDEMGGPAFRIMWAVHQGRRPPLIKNLPKPLELLMTRCWSGNPVERPSMAEVVRIMSHLFQFFGGSEEPLIYDGGDQSDYSYRNTNRSQYTTVSSSQGSTVGPQQGEWHGGSNSDTVRHGVDKGLPIQQPFTPSRPVVVETSTRQTPTIVVEEERGRKQQSAPPSLAASRESLNSPRSRSGTPVQVETSHKRFSDDLSEHDELNLNIKPPARAFGHRRSGSHGTPYVFIPTTVQEQAVLGMNRYPSFETLLQPHSNQPTPYLKRPGYQRHERSGSDESNRISLQQIRPSLHSVSTYPTALNEVCPQGPPKRSVSNPAHTRGYGLPSGSTPSWASAPVQSSPTLPPPIQTSPTLPPPRHVQSPSQQQNPLGYRTEDMNRALLSVDYPLQPLNPCTTSPESMTIYTRHCELMKDYLRERTEMTLLLRRKKELTRQVELNQQNSGYIANEYAQLFSEKESLTTLHQQLKNQVESLRQRKRNAIA